MPCIQRKKENGERYFLGTTIYSGHTDPGPIKVRKYCYSTTIGMVMLDGRAVEKCPFSGMRSVRRREDD